MPYIPQDNRTNLEVFGGAPETAGELNYLITRLVDGYLLRKPGGYGYADINEVVGALECAKLEAYRRLAAPYEDKKMALNGDVYFAKPKE